MSSHLDNAQNVPLGGPMAWLRAVVARWRSDQLCGIGWPEFEQIARDFDLSPPELYGRLTGLQISDEALRGCLTAEAPSPQYSKQLRALKRRHRVVKILASMPISPCCC